ncbi:amidohydrolase family protein [Streptomyces sp. NPDC056352]|uniref:amidohydrolase family protein n=1 Tax=Streptomyces sp. NPDC056352 TaxID=3345791 RepID=UPI0035DA1D0E
MTEPVHPDTPPAAPAGIIETHIHLWDREHIDYPWLARWPHLGPRVDAERLTGSLPALAGAVFIEAAARPDHAAAELAWLAEQAARCPFPTRVVAQLVAGDADWWRGKPGAELVSGLRRVMHHAPAGDITASAFAGDMRAAGEAGLPVDLTIRHEQLAEVAELCRHTPGTTFVLDHLGKPAPHLGGFDQWTSVLAAVAANPNTVCKLSSIAVQAGDPQFHPETAQRYVARALEVFGADRCLYGTDWPVLTHATTFDTWLGLVSAALAPLSPIERDAVLRGNAARVYGFDQLPPPF